MGTGTERSYSEGQLWQLEASSDYDGYYYIRNVKYANDDYRLDQWGTQRDRAHNSAGTMVSSVNSAYSTSQLWRFDYAGEGYFRIANFHEHVVEGMKLCMYEYEKDPSPNLPLPNEVKSYPHVFGYCVGDFGGDGQLWRLEPRLNAMFERVVAFHVDNRNGKIDLPPKTITMTKGLSTTNTASQTENESFTLAVSAAFEWGPVSGEVSAEYSKEISTTLEKSATQSVEETTETSYIAPAGYDYRVSYLKIKISGNSPGDNIEFWAPEQSLCVEQSPERLPTSVPIICPE